jgi:hypothetical protein
VASAWLGVSEAPKATQGHRLRAIAPTRPPTLSSLSEQLASADQSAAEGGSTPKAGQVPDTAGTPLMNQAAQGKATSPQDVLKQNEGQPTVGDTAQAQSLGQSTQVAGSSPMEASNLLKQAKDLDKAGKENECMAIIQKAKQQIGAQ